MKLSKAVKLVILGISGGGKGTQAKKLAREFGWIHISMGRVFREEIASKSKIGLKAAECIKYGFWVPTDLTFKLLKPILEENFKKGFIIDGFPRVPDQPKILDQFLTSKKSKLDLVIHLVVSPEVVLARRKKVAEKGKGFYDEKRKDESIRAIKNRFLSYQKTIKPILDYYRHRGILFEVDGERSVAKIYQDIVKLVKGQALGVKSG